MAENVFISLREMLKKVAIVKSLFAVAVSFCVLLAPAALPLAKAQVPGGASEASVKDRGVVQAAQFAIEAQQAVAKAAGKAEKLTLVKIVSARQQVVQGMNYHLALEVKVGGATKTAKATVWVRLWLKGAEQYKLTSWKYADEKESKPAGGGK